MNDYRIFVGAFPQGELAEHIQAVRLRYDPITAYITAPHVTLAGTYWRSGPATAANETQAIERLEQAAARQTPFNLLLGGIRTFPPRDKPVIYLGVEATADLLAMRQALLSTLGTDKHGARFTPHLTLAMRLRPADAENMLVNLRHGDLDAGRFTAPIRAISLMQRGPHDKAWREIARMPLAVRVTSHEHRTSNT